MFIGPASRCSGVRGLNEQVKDEGGEREREREREGKVAEAEQGRSRIPSS